MLQTQFKLLEQVVVNQSGKRIVGTVRGRTSVVPTRYDVHTAEGSIFDVPPSDLEPV